MKSCVIIGISDSHQQWFVPEVKDIIAHGRVFSGGKRHHKIIEQYLPKDAEWIDITIPLSDVFAHYERYDDVIIFASGDPLFYGFAATVQREVPECSIKVYPSFNSLQMLAHRMCLPYQDMHVVSLTGRPWDRFDEALIRGYELIGVLTDKHNTPQTIMERMLRYGYSNYTMTVGENLGNNDDERIGIYDKETTYAQPNCVILQRTHERHRPFGIPESEFHLLNGRAKMITKMPIRLLSLSMLDLHNKQHLWDIGFCTGSVSIEAKLQFPHIKVTSFEVRAEGKELIQRNAEKFGTPGITAVTASMPCEYREEWGRPDAVFIGGHGGKLKEIVAMVRQILLPGGCIVFNSVSEESRTMFYEAIEAVGMAITQDTRIAIDDHNLIHIMKGEASPLPSPKRDHNHLNK